MLQQDPGLNDDIRSSGARCTVLQNRRPHLTKEDPSSPVSWGAQIIIYRNTLINIHIYIYICILINVFLYIII